MTDRYTVYIKVLKMLKQMITIEPREHIVTLAMMIAGIVTGRNAQLSAMSTEIAVAAKEKSVGMRLRRWVKGSQVDTEAVYMPFAKQILAALAAHVIYPCFKNLYYSSLYGGGLFPYVLSYSS